MYLQQLHQISINHKINKKTININMQLHIY